MKNLLILGATLLGTTAFIGSAIAQQAPNSNQSGYQTNERSATGSSTLGDFNPLNLIHNANLQRSRGSAEFREDSNTEINRAAEEFKRQQRERLQNPQTPNSTPATEKP